LRAAQPGSPLQATQVLLPLQMGVLPPHWLLVVHWTQAPLPAQTGLPEALMHSGPLWQARQVPDAQMGAVAGQSGWPRHCRQAPAAPQMGLVGKVVEHSVLGEGMQARQRPVARLQNGVFPEQSAFPWQATHEPLVAPPVEQKGKEKAVMHSALPAQARQLPPSQKGVSPPQWLLSVHDWHRWVAVLHLGLAPLQ